MKKRGKMKRDLWAGRRESTFAANKTLADKLAHQRGGKCLSGPQRKCDKWLWKCGVSEHKAWKATLYQIEGYRGRKGTWCRLCSASGWAKRRTARFAANKKLADELAKKKGGRCLSGPQRKHAKWRWKNTACGRQRFARYRELARRRDPGVRNAWGETCLERFTKRGRSGSAEMSSSMQEEPRMIPSGGASFMMSFHEASVACSLLTLFARHATRR